MFTKLQRVTRARGRRSILWGVCLAMSLAACSASLPSKVGPDDGGAGNGSDGRGSNSGSDAGSGSVPITELRFAIVGDTRPASPDDTAHYPSAVITTIYQDIEAESPRPQFAVSTGDYMFASTYKTEQQPQLAKYMAARAMFSGTLFPAMGNHECTGATASNCGQGATDGITPNMTDFIDTMLSPIGETSPYYTKTVAAPDSSWTAKFVVVACNAWSSTQASWLTQQLSQATTYTFVVRHEGVDAVSQTPCSQSQTIIDAHPLTLLIVGHTHTYHHYSTDHEVVVGIGGAPLTSGTNYGYTIVSRNASGTLTVTTYDYQSHATLDTFTIQASGAAG